VRMAHVVQGEMKVGFRGAFSLVRFFCASKRNERPQQGAPQANDTILALRFPPAR